MDLHEVRRRLQEYQETDGHHAFKAGDKYYEGYILEILSTTIKFSYAPTIDGDHWTDEEIEVPIDLIDMSSLGAPAQPPKPW